MQSNKFITEDLDRKLCKSDIAKLLDYTDKLKENDVTLNNTDIIMYLLDELTKPDELTKFSYPFGWNQITEYSAANYILGQLIYYMATKESGFFKDKISESKFSYSKTLNRILLFPIEYQEQYGSYRYETTFLGGVLRYNKYFSKEVFKSLLKEHHFTLSEVIELFYNTPFKVQYNALKVILDDKDEKSGVNLLKEELKTVSRLELESIQDMINAYMEAKEPDDYKLAYMVQLQGIIQDEYNLRVSKTVYKSKDRSHDLWLWAQPNPDDKDKKPAVDKLISLAKRQQ